MSFRDNFARQTTMKMAVGLASELLFIFSIVQGDIRVCGGGVLQDKGAGWAVIRGCWLMVLGRAVVEVVVVVGTGVVPVGCPSYKNLFHPHSFLQQFPPPSCDLQGHPGVHLAPHGAHWFPTKQGGKGLPSELGRREEGNQKWKQKCQRQSSA